MRGQTQALTTVLITTVIIGSIATAYIWGTPLLDKRGSRAELENVENEVRDLHQSIIDASQSGKGATTKVDMSLKSGEIEVNSTGDYIDVFVTKESSPYPSNTWILIKGKSLQDLSIGEGSYGIRNQDLPGVIAVRASGGSSNIIQYRIDFRNLKDTSSNKLHKIDLKTTGRTKARNEISLLLTNKGTEIDPSVSTASGENLERIRTKVDVDIQ